MWIFVITYNFDGDYIAKKCNSYDAAVKMLNDYLAKEVETVKSEDGYNPSILKWSESDVTLVYAEGHSFESVAYHNYHAEDCAEYRVFKVE